MATRTLGWKNFPWYVFQRFGNGSRLINSEIYSLNDLGKQRNFCLCNSLKHTENTFCSPIGKQLVEPNLGFYNLVVRSYAKSRDKKKGDKGKACIAKG